MAIKSQPLSLSSAGLELIKRFEGFRAEPYYCSAGKLTVGYGHCILPGSPVPASVTVAEATKLLAQDVEHAETTVRAFVLRHCPLAPHEFDALVSLTYNIGSGNFRDSTLLELLKQGKKRDAADEFLRWVKARGRELPGLVKRRTAERAMFLGDKA